MTPSKLIIGPIDQGQVTNREAFNIDNDAFPTLFNAYQWRGRIKRKRGTEFLIRLTRYFNSSLTAYSSISSFALVAGAGNLFTGFALESTGNIVPGSISIVVGANTYTDPGLAGVLVGAPGGSGTVNYATGDITISGGGAGAVSGQFIYYPGLPVLGLEDFKNKSTAFTGKIGFDTTYAYVITTSQNTECYSVSFYKNLPTGTYLNYVQKTITNPTKTSWNGETYQQFWSVNYQGALWVTNGIRVPFGGSKIGMQFNLVTGFAIVTAGNGTTIPAVATVTIASHGLVIGDFLFFNEIQGLTGINFQTGYVTGVVNINTVTVTFSNATLGGAYTSGGIAQYLTSRADTTVDCIRWYDGDPTNANATSPTFVTGLGWVNFMPPLSFLNFSITNLPARQYYLAGCRMIVPFKDRLLFIGPVVQASTGAPIYLEDTVVYSQNGTAYYTASFPATRDSDVSLPTTAFTSILVPENQTGTPSAYFEDQTGFGGFISAGVDKPAITVQSNEDVLMIGFDPDLQTKLIYSGNDLAPFNFYLVNSEFGASSTFSTINLDVGVITTGTRGIVISSQDQVNRIDLDIPDQIFQFNLLNNGNERVTAQRDFINEWIYFTYLANESSQGTETSILYPNQTLFYNYRDSSWAIFNESYTHYGQYTVSESLTWATIGKSYKTWKKWNDPWDSGNSTAAQPDVIAGNQQGFVVKKGTGTGEGTSLSIQSIVGSLVTSPDHGLNSGDFVVISGAIGTIGSLVNNIVFKVDPPNDNNTFTLNPNIDAGTYLGGGLITRLYNPFIQTKQFPAAWSMGRKTRIGTQRYLFTTTSDSEVTLLIYLSQDAANSYNSGPIFPDANSLNTGLIYTTTVFTCPESTNLGLTPAKKNLMTPTAISQSQLWHRLNTSLIGDTIQIAITLSDEQMYEIDEDGESVNATAEIEFHGCILDITPSQMLV
jgi:hypothetical protein